VGKGLSFIISMRRTYSKYSDVTPATEFGPPTSRSAMIYGRDGKVLWETLQIPPRQAPEKIKDLYLAMSEAADKLAPIVDEKRVSQRRISPSRRASE
jgi:hypothetical protein